MNFSQRVALTLGLAVVVAASGSFALAQGTNQNNSNLPPAGVYLTPTDVHAMYNGPGLAIVLSAVQHQPFANGVPGAQVAVNG